MTVVAVFLVALGTAFATGLGALPLLLGRRIQGLLGLGSALAAGFMGGASVGLFLEGGDLNVARTVVGALLGVVFIVITGQILEHRHDVEFGALRGADALGALLIVGVMTLHSFTEGIGVGVSFGDGAALGLLIATAIAIHNIPEGLAISLVLVPRGVSVGRAAAWSVFSSLPQPLMAVPAFLLVESFQALLPIGLGFAGGAMLWLGGAQLIPDALRTARPVPVAAASLGAAGAMIAFQLVLLG